MHEWLLYIGGKICDFKFIKYHNIKITIVGELPHPSPIYKIRACAAIGVVVRGAVRVVEIEAGRAVGHERLRRLAILRARAGEV